MHVTTVRAKNIIIIAAALAGFAAMLCLVLTGSALRIDDPVREALYGRSMRGSDSSHESRDIHR